jgi:hypothetical protein
MLDPCCGARRLIAARRDCVGVDTDGAAVPAAGERAARLLLHEGDLSTLAVKTKER